MKKTLFGFLIVLLLIGLTGCSRGEGGGAGYGAGGGQSLREGSTSPLHSDIAQDQTYQKILGLNILLYPPPVDDPKFEPYGTAYWDLDPKAFVELMKSKFSGQMGEQPVYEPQVEGLLDDPLIQEIQKTIYEGQPIQVGWIYGNNSDLNYLEYNGAPVTLITADNVVLFVGDKAKLDSTAWTFATDNAKAFYLPANAVVTLKPDTLRSAPIRVSKQTGQLTAVITSAGTGVDAASPGEGMDQALISKGRWIFALPDVPGGYYTGLTGSNKSIVPAD